MTSEQIRRARTDLGMTQQEFAHEIGVSMTSVMNWESGRTRAQKIACRAITALIAARAQPPPDTAASATSR